MGKIEVKCFALNDFAQGVFKIGKQNEYANNLLPKEVANVDKGKNGKYYVSSYLKKSESRVDPKCELYNKCGGCHILHMNKEAQKEFKLDYVTTALKDNYMVSQKLLRLTKASSVSSLLKFTEEDIDLLEDVIIENKQALEMVEMHRNILENMMDAFAFCSNLTKAPKIPNDVEFPMENKNK